MVSSSQTSHKMSKKSLLWSNYTSAPCKSVLDLIFWCRIAFKFLASVARTFFTERVDLRRGDIQFQTWHSPTGTVVTFII